MKSLTLISIFAALLIGAPAAIAADSTQGGYGGAGGNTQVDIEPGGGGVGGETETEGGGNEPAESTDCVGGGGSVGADGVAGTADDCTETTAASAGSLPFTGQDLGLITLVGVLFLLAGFGIRRFSRNSPLA